MQNKQKSKPKYLPDPDLKLMDQVRQVMRYYHYAYRTESAYCDWIVRYIKFHDGRLDLWNIEQYESGEMEIGSFNRPQIR